MSTRVIIGVEGTHSKAEARIKVSDRNFYELKPGDKIHLNKDDTVVVNEIINGGTYDENYKELIFVDNADAASAGGAIYLVGDTKELGAEGFELNRRFASLYNFLDSMSGRKHEMDDAKGTLHTAWVQASISYRRRDEDEPA